MKHNFFRTALAGVALLLTLPACAKQADSEKLPTPTPYVPAPTVTAAPTPIPTPIPFTEIDPAVLPKEAMEDSDLYRLTGFSFDPDNFLITEDGLLFSLKSQGYELYDATTYTENHTLEVGSLNLETGEIKEYILDFLEAELVSEKDWFAYHLHTLGDKLLLTDEVTSSIYLMDTSCSLLDQAVCSDEEFPYWNVFKIDETHCAFWAYPSYEYFIISLNTDGKLSVEPGRFPVSDDTTVYGVMQFTPDNKAVLLVSELRSFGEGDDAYLATEDYTAILDLSSGALTKLPLDDMVSAHLSGDLLILTDYYDHSVSVYSKEAPDVEHHFTVLENALFLQIDGDTILYTLDDLDAESVTLLTYSLKTGALLSTLKHNCHTRYGYISSSQRFGKTTFISSIYDSEKHGILFGIPSGTEPSEAFAALFRKQNYALENLALKDKILHEFGIPIFISKEAVHFNSSYYTVAESDGKVINDALRALYDTFAAFPKGFFAEMIEAATDYNGFEIYLTADIRQNPNSSNTLTTAGGFVTTANRIRTMTVDITDPGYKKTFAHEFMHIIEDIMYQKLWYSDVDSEVFSRMYLLNPKGFDYNYSYENYYGSKNSKYCGSSFWSSDPDEIPDNIYFVDDYCLTYQGEDLARLFETLMCTPENDVPNYFLSDPIQLKAAYLCACIRSSFDCITDDTEVPWERLLKKSYSLEYFIEQYPYK